MFRTFSFTHTRSTPMDYVICDEICWLSVSVRISSGPIHLSLSPDVRAITYHIATVALRYLTILELRISERPLMLLQTVQERSISLRERHRSFLGSLRACLGVCWAVLRAPRGTLRRNDIPLCRR